MSYLAICPTGTVFAFAGTAAPNGWLLCDGSAVSRTVYSQLYSVVANSNGSGDGTTTFNVPDFRGRFLRGVSGSTSNDPDRTLRIAMASGGNTGNAVGSVQGIATSVSSGNQGSTKATTGLGNSASGVSGGTNTTGNHAHSITRPNMWGNGTAGNTWGSGWNNDNVNLGNVAHGSDTQGNHSHSISGTADAQPISGDLETRPVNAYVNYIIKV
jgi:hypothetical protein